MPLPALFQRIRLFLPISPELGVATPKDTMLHKVLALVVVMLACASSFMATSRPAMAMQCPAPSVAAAAPLFMKTADFVVMADELDNSAIAEDSNIMPARKCGFCMG